MKNIHQELHDDAKKRENAGDSRAQRDRAAYEWVKDAMEPIWIEAWQDGYFLDLRKWLTEQALDQVKRGIAPNIPRDQWPIEQLQAEADTKWYRQQPVDHEITAWLENMRPANYEGKF